MRANQYLLILALGIASPSFAQQIQTADKLYQNFQTPVNEAKPRLWWHWMNGNITKEGIQKDLESRHYKCPKNRENLLELPCDKYLGKPAYRRFARGCSSKDHIHNHAFLSGE